MRTPVDAALARICRAGGTVAGAGVLLTNRHVVTCAHVVNESLRRELVDERQPTDPVLLDFPFIQAQSQQITARVIVWRPVQSHGGVPEEVSDIAVLEINEIDIPSQCRPPNLLRLQPHEILEHRFSVLGFPVGQASGVGTQGRITHRQANNRIQLEITGDGYRIEGGFSGSPIWDRELEGVAGITVAIDPDPKRQGIKVAFMIPAASLIKAWPVLDDVSIASPYRGLSQFLPEDERFFFGRETVIRELLGRVETKSLTAVVGASGSGKSSVVFAGLVPKLRRKVGWDLVDIRRLNDRPLYGLLLKLLPFWVPNLSIDDLPTRARKALERIQKDELSLRDIVEDILEKQIFQSFVLVIDQFEELYTYHQQDSEGSEVIQLFLDTLLDAIQNIPALKVVITLRADFLNQALTYRPFADALQDSDYKLAPMNREELRSAIEQPAELLGIRFQDGLTERIIEAVESKPGYLPPLEFALTELWQRQEHGYLTHQRYEEIGEVTMALANYADREYQSLKQDYQRQQTERIFIQLVHPGDSTADTRRLATRQEVGEENWELVRILATKRLIVTGIREVPNGQEEIVEIVHEALIEKWERLRDWIQSHREFRIWQERLRASLKQWQIIQAKDSDDQGALLRGFPLTEALNWLQERQTYLTPDERQFIEQSRTVAEQELEERKEKEYQLRVQQDENQILQKANRQAKRTISSGFAVFCASMVIAVGLIATATHQRMRAQEGTRLEQEGVSALRQLPSGELEALQAALNSAYRLNQLVNPKTPPEQYPAVSPILALQKILATIQERNRFDRGEDEIKAVRFSPDGETVVTAGETGIVQLWSLSGDRTGELTGHVQGVLGGINDLAFSADGQTLVTAGGDETVRVWNVQDGSSLEIVPALSVVNSVAISPDSQSIVIAGDNSPVKRFDMNGKEVGILAGHQGGVLKVRYSPDGSKIVTAGKDGTVRLWNRDGKLPETLLSREGEYIYGISFSPEGEAVAIAGESFASIMTVEDKRQTALNGHIGAVLTAVFSPDGQYIATAGDDGTIRLWDRAGREIKRLFGHRGAIWQVAFSPDGRFLMSAGRDGTSRLWQLERDQDSESPEFAGFEEDVNTLALLPGESAIVAAGDEGIVKIWSRDGQEQQSWVASERGPIWDLDVSPDGTTIVTGGLDSAVRLWDRSGQQIASLRGHDNFVNNTQFSTDGKYVITSGGDKTARIWSVDGEMLTVLEGHADVVGRASFSPDGQQVVTTAWDGSIRLWTTEGKLLEEWMGHNSQIRGVAFSPDGKTLVTVDSTSMVRVWDLKGGLELEFFSYQSGVNDVVFRADGQALVTGGMDGTTRIWDLQGRQMAEWTLGTGSVWGVDLGEESSTLVVGGDAGRVALKNTLNLGSLIMRGCSWLTVYKKGQSSERNFDVCD
jgi:WD40 repeat protein